MDPLSPLVLGGLAAAVATVATVGGLGGAVLLVPLLVLLGVEPAAAVPLGLLSVAASSLAAAAPQISTGLVNQRIGVVVEVAASAGAIGGAALSGSIEPSVLRLVLGGVAVLAALVGLTRSESDEPMTDGSAFSAGELPGRLAGVMSSPGGPVTYEVRRTTGGFAATVGAGFVAGLSGTSGGYLKTPILHHVMGVPAKVAGATTTFTVGITAASALSVLVLQGRLDVVAGSAVVAGAIVGGGAGAAVHGMLPGRLVRVVLAGVLLAIGVVVVVGT